MASDVGLDADADGADGPWSDAKKRAVMKLKSAQVVLFRNVQDSTEVEIQDDITCLVGKNESGKTSFLQALHGLNPAVAKPLSITDYPAWLSKAHKLEGKKLEDERPVRAVFVLDDKERAEVAAEFGDTAKDLTTVTAVRTYGGTLGLEFDFDEAAWVRSFVQQHCGGVLAEAAMPETAVALAAALQAASQTAPTEGEPNHQQEAAAALTKLIQEATDKFTPRVTVERWLEQRVPKFLYFGRYDLLQDTIDIQRIGNATYEALKEDDRIAKALLELSFADVKVATGPDYELRARELNDTANALTLEILDYWTQNTNIRVQIDPEQIGQPNNQSVVKYLHVRLYDSEHMATLPFGERSSGFQWFFSFLCAFSRYRRSHEPVIILLDEPALGLHARAQRDFLRYIEEKLAPRCQVIYTTHSPFMVQPKHLERVRLVEDKGRKEGSKITKDVLSTDADTVFPLQGALGYDLAQSLFVGPYNLVVEGISDFTYLQLLSDHLKKKGGKGLDDRCTIVPVGGAGQVATFAALLGSHVDATVLIDSMKQGNQRLDALVKQGLLKQSRVISVGEITKQTEADIEDLFDVSEYLRLFNEAFKTEYKESDLKGQDPIVRRLARAEGKERFDHGRPAEVLLRKRAELGKLSKETLERFEKLFERINATLPE